MLYKHAFPGSSSLLCLFSVASTLFIFSWFFILRSDATSHFTNTTHLTDSEPILTIHETQPTNQNDATKLFRAARSILVNNEDEEEQEEEGSMRTQIDSVTNECDSINATLKVFMYDLPAEFHFELLDWKSQGRRSVWPDIKTKVPHYPGGLNLQHSIEYWLTLDLLASEFDDSSKHRTAVRVRKASEADVIFVPFFSSLSYNRYSKINHRQKKSKNKLLQEKLVNYLTAQKEWKQSGGRDHIILAHHPNSLFDARMHLWPAIFILSDFGRYPSNIANVEKDLIAPYKHVIKNFVNDTSGFDSRSNLLYFQGAIHRKDGGFVRQELFNLLKDEKGVHFSFGSVQKDGINEATQGMHSSKFCLNIAGDTPSSNRLFDAIASHCVPVIISDEIELPYEDVLDYTEFCIFIRTSDALKEKFVIKLIRGIGMAEWTKMWKRLKEVENMFEYKYPSTDGDAVQMIWKAVARKVPSIRLKIHKSSRYDPSDHDHTLPKPVTPASIFW